MELRDPRPDRGRGGAPLFPASEECRRELIALLSALDARRAVDWTDHLLRRFRSFPILISSPERTIRAALDGEEAPARLIASTHRAAAHLLRVPIAEVPILSAGTEVAAYLRVTQGHLRHEQLRVLYLDAATCLLDDEVFATGAADRIAIPGSAIMRRAVELGAAGIILAHNHPSGSPEPSVEDVRATKLLQVVARHLDIDLLDHLIVTARSVTSMRSGGYL